MKQVKIEITGSVDRVTDQKIEGWACAKNDPETRLKVTVKCNGEVIASGVADRRRDDLVKAKISDGCCAFSLPIKDLKQGSDIHVFAEHEASQQSQQLANNFARDCDQRPQGYQSIGKQQGDSNSNEKLTRLKLPESFRDMKVLDIGCNEGFFCIEARQRGASRVVGIDSNPDIIKRAQQHTSEVEYRACSWWDLPEEKFDIILFLSAIHYERDQKRLLEFLGRRLTDDGVLILECGISGPWTAPARWDVVRRHDGFFRYPTYNLFANHLLSTFAVTPKGPSVSQSGDPVPRFVFHCRNRRPTCILISGQPGAGKSVYSAALINKGIVSFSVDEMMHNMVRFQSEYIEKDTFLSFVKKNCDLFRIDGFISELIEAGFADDFVSRILDSIPLEAELFAIEGYAVGVEEIRNRLLQALAVRKVVVWESRHVADLG